MGTNSKQQPLEAETETVVTDATPRPRKAPDITWEGEGVVKVDVSEKYQLRNLYGLKTGQAARGMVESSLSALGQNAAQYMDFMTAMAVEMEPRDAVEAMLVTQMTATHVAVSTMSLKFHGAQTPEIREAYERSFTRLSRTFLSQMEALKKYRAKAQQIVRVERVEVQDGGQAIVGDVSYRRGEDSGK